MDPATGRPFDRSLLEATLADAARAADTEVGAPGPDDLAGPERHLGLAPTAGSVRATLSSVASLTADLAARPAAGAPTAGGAAIDPANLRLGGRPVLDVASPAVAPLPAPARPAPPVTPAPAGPDPAPTTAPAPAPAEARQAGTPAPDAAAPALEASEAPPQGRRSELRPWQPSDDDVLPATAQRRNRRGLRR